MGAIATDRVARFYELVAPEHAAATLDELLQWVSEDGTLAEFCAMRDVPFGRLRAWIATDPERETAYFAALAIKADALAGQTIAIADDTELFPQDKRVRIDTRFRLAS